MKSIRMLAMLGSLTAAEGPFTWVPLSDHLDEPVEGLVASMVAAKPAFVVSVGDVVFQSRPEPFEAVKQRIIDPETGAVLESFELKSR